MLLALQQAEGRCRRPASLLPPIRQPQRRPALPRLTLGPPNGCGVDERPGRGGAPNATGAGVVSGGDHWPSRRLRLGLSNLYLSPSPPAVLTTEGTGEEDVRIVYYKIALPIQYKTCFNEYSIHTSQD
uniref:Uncharacterized protein n=1 Tax=Sphaerodactylus townsendi TaxID=933632 RepID=A0ACB8G3D7_9SAUR